MTEASIVAVIGKDRVIAGHQLVCPNVNHLFAGQQDMISVSKTGIVIEYEVKISRADFKRDARKGKKFRIDNVHLWPGRVPNQIYYVVPAGLIQVPEIPNWAGLMWVEMSLDPSVQFLVLKKKAPMIHKYQHDLQKIHKKVVTLYQQRQFLGCCLLTYKNRL